MTSPTQDIKRFALRCSDGVALRAETMPAKGTSRAAVVLCHPHPLHGGNMYSHVIGGLFSGLPEHGVTTLRFNFRGTSGSEGRHDGGKDERLDVVAAIEALNVDEPSSPGASVFLVGYSFGANVSLAVTHPAIEGWIAIAPPLTMTSIDNLTAASSERKKHIIVGDRDEFCPPDRAADLTADWRATTVAPLTGENHFLATARSQLLAIVVGAILSGTTA